MADLHQKEIILSDVAIKNSKNEEVLKFAQKVKDDLAKEVYQLKNLESKLGGEVKDLKTDPDLVSEGVVQLKNLTGVESDKAYLKILRKTHEERIVKASKLLPLLGRRDIHHLAVKMVKRQGNEIEKIEKLERSLNR